MKLSDLTTYLDTYLRVNEVQDSPQALNGLQVENSGRVNRLAVAVDACQVTIDRAVELGADLLLVHHGLFWGGLEPLTGRHGNRVRRLVQADIALYSAHIPLDVHPEVGNSMVLATQLGLADTTWFGEYLGQAVGVAGRVDLPRAEFVSRVSNMLAVKPHVIPAGPQRP